MRLLVLFAVLATACGARNLASSQSTRTCLISEYVPDPTNATAGIQAAVNACAEGGDVIFDVPNTNYSTGAILITGSSVHLKLPPKVTLLAGTHRRDYPGPQPAWYLLHFRNCNGCSLSGGVIDGQGRRYVTDKVFDRKNVRNFRDPSCFNQWECRPRMVGVVSCTDVTITGNLVILDPIYWTVHVIASKRVKIEDLVIRGDYEIFNTDGIDIDSSSDVEITGCNIDVADDAVCVKTTVPGVSAKSVRVSDCRLRSRASALKLGTESVADMQDITFKDIDIWDTHRGLSIQLRDGGSVSGIKFSNISATLHHQEFAWWGASEAIYVTAEPRFEGRSVGTVRNVTFEKIKAFSENGIFIAGADNALAALQGRNRNSKESLVGGIKMTDMELILRNTTSFAGGYQDYRPGPWDVDLSGSTRALWVAGADDVQISQLSVLYTEPYRRDWKEMIQVDVGTVNGLVMDQCSFGNLNVTNRVLSS